MNLHSRIFEEAMNYRTQREIASAVGCSHTYVSKVLIGEGRCDAKAKIKIAFLWGADIGVVEIAKQLDIPKWRVIKFLKDQDLLDAKP